MAERRSARRDGHARARPALERLAAGDPVRIGHHDAGGDEVLRQHRVGPLVHVSVPLVLPGAQELRRGARVIDLVEVLAARDVEAPQAEDEREDDEAQQEQGIAAIQAAWRLAEVRVGRIGRQPARIRRSWSRGPGLEASGGRAPHDRRGNRRRCLAPRARQRHRPRRHERENGGDEQAEQPDAGIGEERRAEEGVLGHRHPTRAGVHDAAGERPVLGIDPVDVREERDRDGPVDPGPQPSGTDEKRAERQRREEVALVDARRKHKEGDGQDQRRERARRAGRRVGRPATAQAGPPRRTGGFPGAATSTRPRPRRWREPYRRPSAACRRGRSMGCATR